MGKNKSQVIRMMDHAPDGRGLEEVEFMLDPHFRCVIHPGAKAWTATVSYLGVSCVIRERPQGMIQCDAPWVPTQSHRISTGTRVRQHAIGWACDLLEEELDRLRAQGAVPGGAGAREREPLRLREAVQIIRDLPEVRHCQNDKTKRGWLLCLDIAERVWSDDPYLHDLHEAHVEAMREARQQGRGDDKPLTWPGDHARHGQSLKRVKPQTVEKQLTDIRTLLAKLVGKRDRAGIPYLKEVPMHGLALVNAAKERRFMAGPQRYPAVIACADDAVERIRTTGHRFTEARMYNGAEKNYNRTQRFPGIVPGIFRMLLVLAFGHPTRIGSTRRILRKDVVTSSDGVAELITDNQTEGKEEEVPLAWSARWRHGAILYRREHSKLKVQRIVPLSADLRAEVERYLDKRDQWLEARGESSEFLFPSPRDAAKPISEKDAGVLLAFGEELARERIRERQDGSNPDAIIPRTPGTAWYAYRRYWKSNRNDMGWEANRNAAYVGDWSTRGGSIADMVYARLAPHLILGVVEGKTLLEAIADAETMAEFKAAARLRPDVDSD